MKYVVRIACLLFAVLLLPGTAPASAQGRAGFFRTEGGRLLGPDGQPFLLRGLGLGGWLMPEGYMLHTPGFGSPTTIRRQVEGVLGAADTEAFFDLYRNNYVAEADVAAIAGWGFGENRFNHVRLPFHYDVLYDLETDTFKEEGFALLDAFIGWCKQYGLYVILDMHALPGAQNPGNISDSDGTARLWTEPARYQPPSIRLWAEIARRYKDEPWVIGYDLVNEPVLPQGQGGAELRAFYVKLRDAVRAVDPDHVLFIEGNWYATDFGGLEPAFDDNMVYAFHKYWNATNKGTIQYLLDLRARTGVPLWLGESGENSNPWFYEVVRLMEANDIGWNWWTHKKIETVTAPLSAAYSTGYQQLLDYWGGTGAKPSQASARSTLFELAANLTYARSTLRPDVLAALLDPAFGTTAKPYRAHTLPGTINAVDYDLGTQGVAYGDATFKVEEGSPGIANQGGAYRNDGVDIEASTDPQGYRYNVGWIDPREWLRYTVDVAEAGVYDVEARVASPSGGGRFSLSLGGASLGSINVPQTGGWQSWQTARLAGVTLPAGQHQLRLTVGTAAGFNLNRLRFTRVSGTAVEAGEVPAAFRVLGLSPNPAPEAASLHFEADRPVHVRLTVYDLQGRAVYTTAALPYEAGAHALAFPLDAPAGTYLYRLTADDGRQHQTRTGTFVHLR